MPLKEHGLKNKSAQNEKIEELLTTVGLWDEVKDKLKSPAISLSGGQQQRLCIARSLTLNPEVLLMDEPCSALDPLSTELIEQLILELSKTKTIIISTHNLAQAKRISDETLFFWSQNNQGYLCEYASSQNLFNEAKTPEAQKYLSGLQG